jgi:hypothetical protein
MLSTLLVIGGVLAGLLLLLAVIVGLSARPTSGRGVPTASRGRTPGWVVDAGQRHPDTRSPLSPLSQTSTEIRAAR